jgi:hypothetical protein
LETLIEDTLSKKARFKSMNGKCGSSWAQRPLSSTHRYLMVRDTAVLIDLLNFYKEDHTETLVVECEDYIQSVKKCQEASQHETVKNQESSNTTVGFTLKKINS